MINYIKYNLSKLSDVAIFQALKPGKCVVGLFVFLLISISVSAFAEEEPATSARIEEINQTVEKHTIELKERQEKQKGIEENYNKIKQEVKVISGKQAALKKEYDTAKSQLDTILKEIELTADNIESMERRYAARIRALYMQRSKDLLESVFLISDQTTLKRNAYFMSRIRQSDQKIIEDLFTLKKEREGKIQEMTTVLKQKEDLNNKVTKETKLLNAKLSEQESVLKVFNKEKAGLEQTIASLKAQSLRIETVITSLTGKEKQSRPTGKAGIIKQSLRESKLEAFDGNGLEIYKGQLSIPVSSASIKSLADGQQSIVKMLGAKGLTYQVGPGEDIHSVAQGRVIFNATMPGRGKMVIIDHGKRYYSLYGKLSMSKVEMQQVVEKGSVIGLTEEAGDSSEFYFEIRKNGITADTKSFLKR